MTLMESKGTQKNAMGEWGMGGDRNRNRNRNSNRITSSINNAKLHSSGWEVEQQRKRWNRTKGRKWVKRKWVERKWMEARMAGWQWQVEG